MYSSTISIFESETTLSMIRKPKYLTYEQAKTKSLGIPWVVDTCSHDIKCWCRVIRPIEEIRYRLLGLDGVYYVIPEGILDLSTAHHLVFLHNSNLLKAQSKSDNYILETQEDFSEFLKYLIEDVGMQKMAITRNLGINRMTIHKILKGETLVTKRTIRLANIYLNKMQKQFFRNNEKSNMAQSVK